jgi:hypothetical protein
MITSLPVEGETEFSPEKYRREREVCQQAISVAFLLAFVAPQN